MPIVGDRCNEISGVDQTKYDNLKRLYYAEAAQKEKVLK